MNTKQKIERKATEITPETVAAVLGMLHTAQPWGADPQEIERYMASPYSLVAFQEAASAIGRGVTHSQAVAFFKGLVAEVSADADDASLLDLASLHGVLDALELGRLELANGDPDTVVARAEAIAEGSDHLAVKCMPWLIYATALNASRDGDLEGQALGESARFIAEHWAAAGLDAQRIADGLRALHPAPTKGARRAA